MARVSDEVLDSVRNMLFLEFFWWVFFPEQIADYFKAKSLYYFYDDEEMERQVNH